MRTLLTYVLAAGALALGWFATQNAAVAIIARSYRFDPATADMVERLLFPDLFTWASSSVVDATAIIVALGFGVFAWFVAKPSAPAGALAEFEQAFTIKTICIAATFAALPLTAVSGAKLFTLTQRFEFTPNILAGGLYELTIASFGNLALIAVSYGLVAWFGNAVLRKKYPRRPTESHIAAGIATAISARAILMVVILLTGLMDATRAVGFLLLGIVEGPIWGTVFWLRQPKRTNVEEVFA